MGRQRVREAAAAWVARLASETRTQDDEARFLAWLDEAPGHRAAFEKINDAWILAGGYARVESPERRAFPRMGRRMVLGGAAALMSAGTFLFWRSSRQLEFRTAIGEARSLILADGSRVVLDSGTWLRVALTSQERRLLLVSGRAHFDVQKDMARPFVVSAAGREVLATGTAFDVTCDSGRTVVLLIEGQVVVRAGRMETVMAPGERISFDGESDIPVEDRPDISRLISWQRGYIVFENEKLRDAVDEMSRYSTRHLSIADQKLADQHISGSFSTGDSAAFARSVSLLLGVPCTITQKSILIGGEAS